MLDQGRNRRDTDHSPIDELGYRIALWNGADGDNSATLSLGVGTTSQVAGAGTNSLVVSEPTRLACNQAVQPGLLDILRGIWAPEDLTVTSPEYRRAQRRVDGRAMFGWLTYLTAENAVRLGDIPAGVQRRRLGDGVLPIAAEVPGENSVSPAAELADRFVD